jgi:hypothetical protein
MICWPNRLTLRLIRSANYAVTTSEASASGSFFDVLKWEWDNKKSLRMGIAGASLGRCPELTTSNGPLVWPEVNCRFLICEFAKE